MTKCENCETENDGKYGSGRFCSSKCSRSFSTKTKRKEINDKISKRIKGSGNLPVTLKCENCENEFEVPWSKRNQKCCSFKCASIKKTKNPEYISKLSSSLKKICSTEESRKRLRDIGRKGGFGNRGVTKGGTRYESNLEKECFEYLEKIKIEFEPHKNLPESSKVSDVYLKDYDLWIEIDGINREKRKEWLGKDYEYWKEKIDIYKEKKIKFDIVYSLQEMINLIEKNKQD